MMRSLYSGVAGLRNHQTRMDVIGNNIANVNTVGYKTSRVTFKDIYSETISPATAPAGGGKIGGMNPMQIGLGMSVATVDIIFSRAPAQLTNRTLDLAIGGDGFFVVENKDGTKMFTRAGNFYLDKEGNLVTPDGEFVMGFMNADPGEQPGSEMRVIDDFSEAALSKINLAHYDDSNPDDPARYFNISINKTGIIEAIDSTDGSKVVIGQIAIATFQNQDALQKEGSNKYLDSQNTGDPVYTIPGGPGAGLLNPSALEMSNVDLAAEFSDMIVTQRGFQANSRIITVSDSMLEELVNLKR